MLQIISGKFFASRERYVFEAQGIAYSNFSWIEPIKTCVATLNPVDCHTDTVSYVVNYLNQIEKNHPDGTAGVLVRVGDAEIVDQFLLLASIGLNSFFHCDKTVVSVACRDKRYSSSDDHIPSAFVNRVFSKQIRGTEQDVQAFASFVDKVISLPRTQYLVVMSSIRNYVDGLQLIGQNINLAYSMLVYSLECLVQEFDGFKPTWDDYSDAVKGALENPLSRIPKRTANEIKRGLLKNSNLKLQKRFVDFVTTYIQDDFYIEKAPAGYHAIRKSQFERALKNAYSNRSKYVHALKEIQEGLRHQGIVGSEIHMEANEPYFTLAGLVRVVRHVIMGFIANQETVDFEDVNWRKQLPGIISVQMAPQYWIAAHKDFKPQYATTKINGFLSQLATSYLCAEPITDIRDLLRAFEPLFGKSKQPYKSQMLAVYLLFNRLVPENLQISNWQTTLARYKGHFHVCSIETMLVHILLQSSWEWEHKECVEKWRQYCAEKYRKSALQMPLLFELVILVTLAATALKKRKRKEYSEWMREAILECAGKPKIQNLLQETAEKKGTLGLQDLIEVSK